MDRKIENTEQINLDEKIKIRNAVKPVVGKMVFEELLNKISELKNIVQELDEFKKVAGIFDKPFETQKIEGKVEITNQKEVKFPEVQKVEIINKKPNDFVEKVEVTNQQEIQKVEVTNQQDIQKVEVINQKEIKIQEKMKINYWNNLVMIYLLINLTNILVLII